MIMKKQQGFTLIELLVVIAIIGLLSTLAVVALSSARQKARDAKRVSDMKQVQTSLELYYNDVGNYPGTTAVLGSGTMSCLGGGGNGFSGAPLGCTGTVYMGLIPSNPTPNGTAYSYTSASASATYGIAFTLEGTTGGLGLGLHTASNNGIQ